MIPVTVLMVSTEYPPMPGGVGRYTKNLSLALKRFGLEVYVVCNGRGDGDFSGLDATNEENSNILLKIIEERDQTRFSTCTIGTWPVRT
jgi:hypothetical protein